MASKFDFTDLIGYFSVLVIVICLAFIGLKVTGFATTTDTATVNVTIQQSGAINFTTDFVNFSNGTVDTGASGAYLYTNGTVTDGDWSGISTNLQLENIGNVNVTLALKSNANAVDFIGGATSSFKIKVSENETGSCENNGATDYTELTTADLPTCDPFLFNDSKDSIEIDIMLYIPSDSKSGERSAVITATGTY